MLLVVEALTEIDLFLTSEEQRACLALMLLLNDANLQARRMPCQTTDHATKGARVFPRG